MTAQNLIYAYGLSVIANIGFLSMTAIMQDVTSIPSLQILYWTNLSVAITSFIYIAKKGLPFHFKGGKEIIILILRSICGITKLMFLIFGVKLMPLSEAMVVDMLMPPLSGLFSAIILKEKYEKSLFLVTVMSCMGIIFIAKPGFLMGNANGEDESETLYPHKTTGIIFVIISAIGGAMSQIVLKIAGMSMPPTTVSFYFSSISTVFYGLMQIIFNATKATPSLFTLFRLSLGGPIIFISQSLVTYSYKFGPANKIILIMYLQVLFAYLYDIFFKGIVPDKLSILGGSCIGVSFLILIIKAKLDELEEKKQMKQNNYQMNGVNGVNGEYNEVK